MHITLYIRKDLEDRFKAEEDKSKLINELLGEHYGAEIKKNIMKMGQQPDNWEGPLMRDKKKGKL